jgi:hypothetical protein
MEDKIKFLEKKSNNVNNSLTEIKTGLFDLLKYQTDYEK